MIPPTVARSGGAHMSLWGVADMAVYSNAGHINVSRSGVDLFSTQTPPVTLFPASKLTLSVSVSYPDFSKDWVYGYIRQTVIGFPSNYQAGYALLLSKLLPDEWSASTTIGSVPAKCNYIDVRAVCSWSSPPPSLTAGSPVRSPILQGVETHLQGGSGVLEIGNGFRRALHVGLSGTSIVLTRYQSVRSIQPITYSPWGNSTQFGWSYLTSPNGPIQNKIGARSVNDRLITPNWPYRGGPNDPGVNIGWDNFASSWSITFIITPGRFNSAV